MKHSPIISAFCLLVFQCCSTEHKDLNKDQITSLPLTFVSGFGPFAGYGGSLSEEYTLDNPNGAPWVKTYLPVKGIPSEWRKAVKTMIWLNGYQLVYQNYKAGNISEETYAHLQKSWKWKPDPGRLSEKPIKCFVYVVRGVDKSGRVAVLIDQNNNLDVSDETAFYPEEVTTASWNASYKDSRQVTYEVLREGKGQTSQIPLLIKNVSDSPDYPYWYCFPQYATAELNVNGRKYTIAIQGGFSNPDYNITEVMLLDKSAVGKKYTLGQGVAKGELLTVGQSFDGLKFKNLGVNTYYNTLELQGVKVSENAYSLQVGYRFKPFEAKEFTTGKKIALDQYKGKHLFVDFWGTWCAGCVQTLPELHRIYDQVDKQKVSFLSIAGPRFPGDTEAFFIQETIALAAAPVGFDQQADRNVPCGRFSDDRFDRA